MKMKAVIILCAFSMLTVTGCGNEKTGQTVVVEGIEKTDPNGENVPEKEGELKEENSSGNETPDVEEGKKEDMEELEGTVKSIGEASVVISKTFVEEDEDGIMYAISSAEGSDDEVLITVNFSENTKFELRTVKNSGVNGDSDVTKSEASFSDLKERTSITLSGYFTVPDKEYMADNVIIYRFV